MDLFRVHFVGYINDKSYKTNNIYYIIFKNKMHENVKQPDIGIDVVVDRISIESAKIVSDYLQSLGIKTRIEESDYALMDNQEQNVIDYFTRASAPVLCPRCGSNQITTGQRGFNIVTGFIGSNQTVNRCAKCGFSWKP